MRFTLVLLVSIWSSAAFAQHSLWNELLQKYVNAEGWVDYKGFQKDEVRLDRYLSWLDRQNPDQLNAGAAKALWINAYNAYTVKLILQHYPLRSIRDIKEGDKDAWNIELARVGGKTYTLNQIEYDKLLKKYKDYRIHAGVNCASYSCPALWNKAYTAANVEDALERGFKSFVNDTKRNSIQKNLLELSKIFEWFADDFKAAGGVVKVVRHYADQPVPDHPTINYRDYDWSLNSQQRH